jgi:hypothetical protein
MLRVLKRVIENVGINQAIKDMYIEVHTFKGQRQKRYIIECDQLILEFNAYTGMYTLTHNDRGTKVSKATTEIPEIQEYILNNII